MYESSYCSTSSPASDVVSVPDFGYSNRCVVVSHCFNFHFPDDIRCGASLHMLICHLYIFIDEVFVKDFGSFFNLVVFLLLSFKSSLYILAKNPLSDMSCKYFLPVRGSSSNSLYMILLFFAEQKF